MPEDQTNSASDSQNDQQGENDSNLPTTPEGWKKYALARDKRLRETEEKLQFVSGVKSTLEERVKAIEQAQKDKLEKDGDYKALADKHAADVEKYKPQAELAEELMTIIRDSNAERIKNVPDSMKALIPADYPPQKLQMWLNANEALLVKPPAADYDAGAGAGGRGGSGNGTTKLTAEEINTAKQMGISAEDYAKAKNAMLPKN